MHLTHTHPFPHPHPFLRRTSLSLSYLISSRNTEFNLALQIIHPIPLPILSRTTPNNLLKLLEINPAPPASLSFLLLRSVCSPQPDQMFFRDYFSVFLVTDGITFV